MLQNKLQLPVRSLTQMIQYYRPQEFDRGDRSLKTIEFHILSTNGLFMRHHRKDFVGKHLAENIQTCSGVTI